MAEDDKEDKTLVLSPLLAERVSRMVLKPCADPKCDKYFLPTPRGHNQLYHSKKCLNRHSAEKWRKSHPNYSKSKL